MGIPAATKVGSRRLLRIAWWGGSAPPLFKMRSNLLNDIVIKYYGEWVPEYAEISAALKREPYQKT